MNKLFDLLSLFRKGNEIANKESWKDGGNAATLLVPIIMLLVKIAGDFGIGVQLSTEDAAVIAAGIVAVVQFVIHNITSKHAGILPAKQLQPERSDSASNSISAEGVPTKAADVQPVSKPVEQPKVDAQLDRTLYTGG